MSHLSFFNYPKFGEYARAGYHYSQAVRIDNRIEISGQGGWDPEILPPQIHADPAAEVDQTFRNVDAALRAAGGQGWAQVYKVRAFLVDFSDEMVGHLARNFRLWCPGHEPLYTLIGTTKLGIEGMRVEIEVEAHLG